MSHKRGIYLRYKVLKKLYNEYLILFVRKNKLTSCYVDLQILLSLNGKKSIEKQLVKKNISYVIVDELTIVKKYDSIPNEYNKHYYKKCLNILFDTIRVNK